MTTKYNWGGQAQVGPLDFAAQKRVLQLDDIHDDPDTGHPRLVTVSLGVTGSYGTNLAWRAFVQWGAGAIFQELECDWVHGTVLRVPTRSVYVGAYPYIPNPANSLNSGGQALVLTATAALEGAGGVAPLFTQQLPNVLPGASTGALVPPAFARAASFYGAFRASLGTDVYANTRAEWSQGGNVIATVPGSVLAGGAWMPVPEQATMELVNTSGALTLSPTVLWHLDQ